ncbi:MAG: uroporphyrinogen-III synthase [Caldilineaceae bacterium]|nr:uroporphyrinogen-III synthase [Caldilineaceae bacterium]
MSDALLGKRIVVTRAADQADDFAELLAAHGATPLVVPAILFQLQESPALNAAIRELASYSWIVFTSANAVRFFFERLQTEPQPAVRPQMAVVGSATERALRACGHEPAFVPEVYTGEELGRTLPEVNGRRILLPRAVKGTPEIVAELEARGAVVDDIAIYRTVPAPLAPAMRAELEQGVDAVTFTSPSCVNGFLATAGAAVLRHALIACIGPTTAKAAAAGGLTVHIVAGEHTTAGLVEELAGYFRDMRREDGAGSQ